MTKHDFKINSYVAGVSLISIAHFKYYELKNRTKKILD